MFGIGFSEVIVILVVALLIIGPDKLPEVAKTLAKVYNEFRRATQDIKDSVKDIDLAGTSRAPRVEVAGMDTPPVESPVEEEEASEDPSAGDASGKKTSPPKKRARRRKVKQAD